MVAEPNAGPCSSKTLLLPSKGAVPQLWFQKWYYFTQKKCEEIKSLMRIDYISNLVGGLLFCAVVLKVSPRQVDGQIDREAARWTKAFSRSVIDEFCMINPRTHGFLAEVAWSLQRAASWNTLTGEPEWSLSSGSSMKQWCVWFIPIHTCSMVDRSCLLLISPPRDLPNLATQHQHLISMPSQDRWCNGQLKNIAASNIIWRGSLSQTTDQSQYSDMIC